MTTLRLASIAALLGFVLVPAGSAMVTTDAMAFTSNATQPSTTVKKPKKPKIPKKCKKYTKNSKKWKKCVKCAKYTKGSKKWKKCVKKYVSLETEDDIYTAGYWLAEEGKYAEALEVLKRAHGTKDPRILTYIGFSTRKLGDVDTGIGYYRQALAIDPNFMPARGYLGEGFLQKGDLASATGQLDEIKTRCGVTCTNYVKLAAVIAEFKSKNNL